MFYACDSSPVSVTNVSPSSSSLLSVAAPASTPTAASVHLVGAANQNGQTTLTITGADPFGLSKTGQ